MINFGNIKSGECLQKYLFIKNTSGIETQAQLEIKNFKAIEEEIDHDSLLLVDPMKRNRKLSDKYKLKDYTNGIGFGLEKNSLNLAPFQTVCVSLAAIAEMWGTYEDIVIINIDGIFYEHFIPILCNVVDTPIRLYTGKITENENEPCSMIRFGSQIQGSGLISRKLKIQNSSHIPVDIEWKIFLKDTSDDKLIDFNMEFRELNDNDSEKQDSSISQRYTSQKGHYITFFMRIWFKKYFHKIKFLESPSPDVNQNRNNPNLRESVTTLDYYDSGYIYVERVPLIKVCLTNHYGIELTDNSEAFFLNKSKIVSYSYFNPEDGLNNKFF